LTTSGTLKVHYIISENSTTTLYLNPIKLIGEKELADRDSQTDNEIIHFIDIVKRETIDKVVQTDLLPVEQQQQAFVEPPSYSKTSTATSSFRRMGSRLEIDIPVNNPGTSNDPLATAKIEDETPCGSKKRKRYYHKLKQFMTHSPKFKLALKLVGKA
jgi:hypothetical protein